MNGTNQIVFPRSEDKVIVAAYPEGVLVICGWTMSITLSNIKQYLRNFGRNSQDDVDKGFFQHDGKFILSHSGAKLMFSSDEASAVVDFLAHYYDITVAANGRVVEVGLVEGRMS